MKFNVFRRKSIVQKINPKRSISVIRKDIDSYLRMAFNVEYNNMVSQRLLEPFLDKWEGNYKAVVARLKRTRFNEDSYCDEGDKMYHYRSRALIEVCNKIWAKLKK
ncbi:MAG: hypothetical protein KJO23_07190 [Bacteroidia bacterium]|nr:hypothetical protein [Bacteroidia bacterium]NNM23412.1 hypothetical protein [Flavobacteriaceae bacterium]